MNNLSAAAVDQYGMPIFQTEGSRETSIVSASDVGFYDADRRSEHKDFTATVTTHRVIFKREPVGTAAALCWEFPLECIQSLTMKNKSLFKKHSRLEVETRPRTGKWDPVAPSVHSHVKFVFRGTGEKEFHEGLCRAMEQAEWTHTESTRYAEAKKKRAGAVGLGGILKIQKQTDRERDALLGAAFDDMSVLMKEARSLANMATALATQLKASQGKEANAERDQLSAMLSMAGLASPVTREVSNDSYTVDLARQVAGFIAAPLDMHQGVLQLVDAYAMYNRARGTTTVSPEDFVAATHAFDALSIPLRVTRFSSGVEVLVDAAIGTDMLVEAVATVMASFGGAGDVYRPVNVALLAREAGMNLVLAREALNLAEDAGTVCRDDHLGVAYYRNFFVDQPAG